MAKVTPFFLIFVKNMTKNVTIKDIAREAGVSIALVSFVMNNRIGADGKQKYRVSQATEDLNVIAKEGAATIKELKGSYDDLMEEFGFLVPNKIKRKLPK